MNSSKKKQISFVYELKPNTKTSYYLKSGDAGYLPLRIGIKEIFAPDHHTGQGKYEKTKGQMKAAFRKSEISPDRKNRNILNLSIYEPDNHPEIYGYGNIKGTTDLVIFRTTNSGTSFIIDIFKDMLFEKEEVFDYLIKTSKRDEAPLISEIK